MIDNYAEEIDFEIPLRLRQYVFACIKGESESAIKTIFPVHPIGFPLLVSVYNETPIVRINGERLKLNSKLMVNGQVDRDDIELEIDGRFGQIGFVLAPMAIYYLFHRPGLYFSNLCHDFEAVTPLDQQHFVDRLSKCKLPETRLPILLEIIHSLAENRLDAIEWLDDAVATILRENGIINLSELAEQSDVSPRHFRRKFREIVGLSPKYFCKVIQINTVFESFKSSNVEELHRLALDCGYYDQAHFINDFNRLIGSSPTHFLNGEHAYIQTYLGRKGR